MEIKVKYGLDIIDQVERMDLDKTFPMSTADK
jgi:hypothetical protein